MLTTTTTFSIATLITMIGDILTGAVDWAGTVIDFVVDQPLILFFVVLGGIYIGVNLVQKLMRM